MPSALVAAGSTSTANSTFAKSSTGRRRPSSCRRGDRSKLGSSKSKKRSARRPRDDNATTRARPVGTSQRGEEAREQPEVANMVHRELRLEPPSIAR